MRILHLDPADHAWMQKDAERHAQRRSAWQKLRAVRRVAGLLLAGVLVALTGVVTASTPTSAIDVDEKLCDQRSFDQPDDSRPGMDALIAPSPAFNIVGQAAEQSNRGPNTLYGQYGTAGTSWPVFAESCLSTNRIFFTPIANMTFSLAKSIDRMALSLVAWIFDDQLLEAFVGDGSSSTPLTEAVSALHVRLFLSFMAAGVMIAGLVMAYRVLVQRRGGTVLMQKALWTVAVATGAMVFAAQASSIVSGLNSGANDITKTIIAALAGNACDDQNASNDCVADSMYRALVFEPWATGLTGSAPATPNPAQAAAYTTDSGLEMQTIGDWTYDVPRRILRQRAFSARDEAKIAEALEGDEGSEDYKDAKTAFQCTDRDENENWDPDTDAYEGNEDRTWTCLGKWKDRNRFISEHVADEAGGEPRTGSDMWTDKAHAADGDFVCVSNCTMLENYMGQHSSDRVLLAMLALIAALGVGIIVMFIALSYLLLEIGTVLFAMIGPIFFLIGLIPEWGQRLFVRWIELFLGTVIKRVALGAFIGVMLALYSILFALDDLAWFMRLLMATLVAVFALVYRKKFLEMFELNLSGGDQRIHTEGEAAQKTRSAAGTTGLMAVSAGAGALAAKGAGKRAMLKGAGSGALHGVGGTKMYFARQAGAGQGETARMKALERSDAATRRRDTLVEAQRDAHVYDEAKLKVDKAVNYREHLKAEHSSAKRNLDQVTVAHKNAEQTMGADHHETRQLADQRQQLTQAVKNARESLDRSNERVATLQRAAAEARVKAQESKQQAVRAAEEYKNVAERVGTRGRRRTYTPVDR